MGMRSCKDHSYPSPNKLGVKVKRKEDAFFKKIVNKLLKFLWKKIKSENKHKHLEKGKWEIPVYQILKYILTP